MKTITISNHKGGVAKTTTALNVAVLLAKQGSRVLAVDLDPQGNLSLSLGADLQELEESRLTSHRLLLSDRDYSAFLQKAARPRLDLLPACLDADAEGMVNLETVSGDALTVQVQPSGNLAVFDESGNVYEVTIADVTQSNGVIHVVDGVLLPQ